MAAPIISLDFELAGVLDLAEVGADVWTKHPDTVPILAGFAIDHDAPQCIVFDVNSPLPHRFMTPLINALLDAIAEGAEIHAWNAAFEWAVWNNICVPRLQWPVLPIERFHCTMAAAACAGLPMNLDDASQAIGSPHVKDVTGRALMKRMARPRVIEPDGIVRWWHRAGDLVHTLTSARVTVKGKADAEARAKAQTRIMVDALIAYNLADVEAERAVHLRIPRMTSRERKIWLVDQHMNQRGLPVDCELLTALHAITLQELLRLNAEIKRITGGVVSGAAQHARLLAWLQNEGYPGTSLAKDTLLDFVSTPEFFRMAQDGQDVVLLRAEAAKTSTAKLVAINAYSRNDGFARNLVQYGGAVRTLRWAGRGPQIQNFPRPVVKHVDKAIEQILEGMDADSLRHLFGRPLDVVSSCLRGVFKAPAGRSLVVCDYHAIEAIVLAWLAGFEPLLDVFRRHEDVYAFTAASVGSTSRQLGKVLRLACGYGMGPPKFQETATTHGLILTDVGAIAAVRDFRAANVPIVTLWHACEATAKAAVQNPGYEYTYKKLKFRMGDSKGRLAGALLMELPSGRRLVYRNARVDGGRIVYWGVNQYTRQWGELDTYGGKLAENATQAVARDLLAETMVALDREFPDTLLTTVHDEIVAMTTKERADELFAGMRLAMSTPPSWAHGMPLSCTGGVVERYGKL